MIKVFQTVDKLQGGSCFGERALTNNQRRAARIVSTDLSYFGILDKIEFSRICGDTIRFEIN